MAAQIVGVEHGIVTLRVSGRLTQAEIAASQREMVGVMERLGRISILVLTEDFDGWEQGGQWNDFAFQEAHDSQIGRMAIVGEERWRDLALLFTSQGLRPFPIEFFPPPRMAEAMRWLAGGMGPTVP